MELVSACELAFAGAGQRRFLECTMGRQSPLWLRDDRCDARSPSGRSWYGFPAAERSLGARTPTTAPNVYTFVHICWNEIGSRPVCSATPQEKNYETTFKFTL